MYEMMFCSLQLSNALVIVSENDMDYCHKKDQADEDVVKTVVDSEVLCATFLIGKTGMHCI